uniref:Hematopoietic cell signal transducer n=1 Tax=Maylandia zebra TaxID=106582 RepID=A0A3P9C6H7_9CICH
MANNKFLTVVLFGLFFSKDDLIVFLFSFCTHTQNEGDSTVSCYRIEPGTIAGIICADVVLTLIIVVVTYRCASFRRQKIDNGKMTYPDVEANCLKLSLLSQQTVIRDS